MALGPGKYDPECTQIFMDQRARGTLLIVIDGSKGSGFSVTTYDPQVVFMLPKLLRFVAEQIEQQQPDEEKGKQHGQSEAEGK